MSYSTNLLIFIYSFLGMEFSAPKFLATPRDTKALDEGSEVTLDCAANGNPMPEIMWLKDGETIDLNHLDSRFTKLGKGSLHIKEVRKQDAGTYQCRAQNSEDSIDAAAVLQVRRFFLVIIRLAKIKSEMGLITNW